MVPVRKDGRDILRGVSAEIPAGDIYAILGGNGAGKSTTLKAICGICRPYRGKIRLFGKPMEKYSTKELFRGCIAMLPQDPKSLFVKKTVREDLAEMTADAEKIARTAELCQITPLLESHPYDLSGGEQQRAALAKVLLTEPKLLLLDEPTKGIDSFFKETFAAILADLKSRASPSSWYRTTWSSAPGTPTACPCSSMGRSSRPIRRAGSSETTASIRPRRTA